MFDDICYFKRLQLFIEGCRVYGKSYKYTVNFVSFYHHYFCVRSYTWWLALLKNVGRISNGIGTTSYDAGIMFCSY